MKRQQAGFPLGQFADFTATRSARTKLNPLSGVIRRGWAWAPVPKAAALFVLPFPLILAALAGLISGDLTRFGFSAGALGCFWSAGLLAWRGAAAEARYLLGERPELPPVPYKLLSAAATAVGAAIAATAGGHPAAVAVVFGGIGAAGHVAFFGSDLRRPRIHVTAVAGVDSRAVRLQLEQAYGRLRRIESAALSLALPEFLDRLSRIVRVGRDVLAEIERDPRDAARARRFLNLYLESAERVALEYASASGRLREPRLEQHFRQLLVEMESTFAEQHRQLTDRDLLSLDVDMEVLKARLKQDGPG